MITHARLRHFGVPALKVRRFASTIKGEPVERALAILDLQSSPTCQTLSKLLRSAVANAMNNHQLSAEYLQVSNVLVDQGPTMKRIRPRARGRAYRVLKRSSHVTIELDLIESQRGAPTETEIVAEKEPAKASKRAPAKKKESKAKPAGKTAAKTTKAKQKTADKPATKAKKASTKSTPKKGKDKE
jgi:large subunit ribosomal protein L22